MEVGLIGLGRTARAMARNLLAAGHQLTLFDPASEAAEDLAKAGATIAARLRDVCNADAVVTALSGGRGLEELVLGPNGVVAVMPAGTVHISMSTISVALSRRLAAAHKQRIQRYIAAPVLGGPGAAAVREIYIFAGGPADLISYCETLFGAVARRTFEVSDDPAAANLLQLCSLGLIGSLVEGLGEAVALAKHGGISPPRFVKLMSEAVFDQGLRAGYDALLKNAHLQAPRLLTVIQARKHARLLLESANTVGAATPIMDLVSERLRALEQAGLGNADWLAYAVGAGGNDGR
jgi:3-hydroxyisobutyrate dehydrogenase-like beta-hydroxyacid dehydrogenase